jgi:Ankyrin repeats (3 copies)
MMNSPNKKSTQRGVGMRVPRSLQALFLRSNLGQDDSNSVSNDSPLGLCKRKSREIPPMNINKIEKRKTNKVGSIQKLLELKLSSRGYDVVSFEALKSGYRNQPTELQKASFGTYLIQLVKEGSLDTLEDLLDTGLSPNPSNRHGESLVHIVCRLGQYQILQVLLDRGASVQIADDSGRTPLHEICSSINPSFHAVAMLLEVDKNMFFMTDRHGYLPLSYVPKTMREQWTTFLERKMDEYWPRRSLLKESLGHVPKIIQMGPNSRLLRDPENALTSELAAMVAAGTMDPEEATYLMRHPSQSREVELSKSSSSFSEDDLTDCESDCEFESVSENRN